MPPRSPWLTCVKPGVPKGPILAGESFSANSQNAVRVIRIAAINFVAQAGKNPLASLQFAMVAGFIRANNNGCNFPTDLSVDPRLAS